MPESEIHCAPLRFRPPSLDSLGPSRFSSPNGPDHCSTPPCNALSPLSSDAQQATLFIFRDACSDSIAKQCGTCFCGGGWDIAQFLCDMLQNGLSHRCACVKLCTKERYCTILGELLTSLRKYRATWAIVVIASQYCTIWGQ